MRISMTFSRRAGAVRLRRPAAILAVLAGALTAAACESGGGATVPVTVEGIRLDQTRVEVDEGGTARLRVVVGSGARGISSGAQVVWLVRDPEIATVADGVVTGQRPGTTRVTVTVDGKQSAHADVTVLAVPGTMELLSGDRQAGIVGQPLGTAIRVRVLNRQGVPMSGVAVVFRPVESSGVVTPGAATLGADGTAELAWTLGPRSGPQAIDIRLADRDRLVGTVTAEAAPGPVAKVQVTPIDALTTPGGRVRYSAAALDEYGNVVPGAQLEWQVVDPAVADIAPDGMARALTTGETEIEAVYVGDGAGAQGASQTQAPTENRGKGWLRSKKGTGIPGQVTDLRTSAATTTSVTLSFTQVGDGDGIAADYEMRYAPTPIGSGFGSAAKVSTGSCRSPIQGGSIGATLTCVVEGLESNRSYDFQVAAFRGTLGVDAVFGPESNVATGRTSAALAPATLELIGGNNQVGAPGAPLANPISVRVKDALGQAMSDVTVSWAVTSGGGSVSRTQTVTNALGVAEVQWTLGPTAGTQAARAAVGSLTAGFSATAQAAAVASVSVTPASAKIGKGQSTQLAAEARDAQGRTVTGTVFTWYSSDAAKATVSSSGTVTGLASGSATIRAAAGGVEGSAAITVEETATASRPATVTTLGADSAGSDRVYLHFTEVDDGTGQPADYSLRYHVSPIGWNWGSAVAASQGTCANLEGTSIGATRRCWVGGLSAGVTYDFQLVAERTEADGSKVFSPSLSNVATASTLASGQGTLSISPRNTTLQALGATQQFAATARDAGGAVLSNPGITWTSSNTSIATIDGNGMLTARGIGTVMITAAAACCVSDQVTVTIQQTVASVSVDPGSASLSRGQTMRLSATARDANGYPINGSPVSWQSSNAGVVSVASDGTVRGEAAGTASVTASSGGRSAASALTVQDSPPPTSGSWPNEPADFLLAVDEPFIYRTLSTQPAGRWEWGNNGETTSDMTIEPGALGTAMRWTYDQGRLGGDSPGRAVITSTAMQFRSVYIGVLVRWSVPWTPHPSGANKILYWGSMEAREQLGYGPGQFYINRRGSLIDVTLQYAQANGQSNVPSSESLRTASTRVDDGQWHRLELLMDGNGAGQSNCRVRVWVDGVLNFDIGGLVCANGDARFYGINLDPIWGGIGETKPQTEWLEMDHVRMSGR